MPSYTDPFGGSTLQAAQVAYRAVALSASIVTVWPPFATATTYLARIMDVTPSAGSLTITLPEATLVSQGQDVFFTNKGAQTYTILDSSGATVATVAAGQVKYLYLTSNATDAGEWSVLILGVGSSNLDAAALAGLGLKAITTTLNAASVVTTDSTTPRTIATTDRAKTYVWTGGVGAYTLPLVTTATSDFFFEVRNQGSGVLTITPSGGELIDDSVSISLQLNESAIVHAGPTAWYTVGRGRNTQFDFTQLVKAVTAGTYTLSLTEAANVVQTYTGALSNNVTIVVPAVVQVYFVRNQTTGIYNFRVQSPTPGDYIDIPSDENAILFCDGTNVYNATTYVTEVTTFPNLTVNSRSSNSVFVVNDRGSMNQFTGTFTQTFESAGTLTAGWYIDVQNIGTGVITFDPNSTDTFNTPAGALQTINVYPGEGFRVVCNGTGFDLVGRAQEVLISKTTISGAPSTSSYETGFTDTEFAFVEVAWEKIILSGVLDLLMRVRKSGAYLSSATYDAAWYSTNVATSTQTGAAGATSWNLTFSLGFSAGASGKLRISRPTEVTANHDLMVDASMAGYANRLIGGLTQSTSAAIQGVQFLPNGVASISSGVVYVRGIRG
jgi:hypothetical protein